MSFLDKPVSELTLGELQRLISREVARQTPAIPAGVAGLDDSAAPLIRPSAAPNLGEVLAYDPAWDDYLPCPITSATDGTPPSSPVIASVKGGVGFFAVSWTPVTNTDLVEYDIHVSTTTGFTPDSSTLSATVSGSLMFVRAMPNGDPLIYGTTYYFKVIARDNDGSSAASTQIGAAMVPANQEDLAVDSVTADQILAGAVTAEKLEAVMVLANLIATGTTGSRVEFDTQGIRLYDSAGNISLYLDATTGTIQLRGEVAFGRDPLNPSRLTNEDLIEFYQRPVAVSTPGLVQSATSQSTLSGTTGITATLPSPPTAGNVLVFRAVQLKGSGTANSFTAPAGFTAAEATLHSGNSLRLTTYYKENCDASDQSVLLDLASGTNGSGSILSCRLTEFSGMDLASFDVSQEASGTSTAVNTGTTAATAAADEMIYADFAYAWTVNSDPTTVGEDSGTYFGQSNLTPVGNFSGLGVVSLFDTVGSTGTYDRETTLAVSRDWCAHILTFKLRVSTGAPLPPDVDRIRLYAKEIGTASRLHMMDEDGLEMAVVGGTEGETWRLSHHTVAVNIPSTAAHTSGSLDVTITGVVSGDFCHIVGSSSSAGAPFMIRPRAITVTDTVTLTYYNADSITNDPASVDYDFIVYHRS